FCLLFILMPPTTVLYTLPLHDALPISAATQVPGFGALRARMGVKFSAEERGVAGEAADGPVAPGGGEGVDGPVAPGCGELGSVGLTAGGSLPRSGSGLLHCPMQRGRAPCGRNR